MQKELDQGYWLIAPEMAANATPEDHVWWRIDPDSGNTLGYVHTGQGGFVMANLVQDFVVRVILFLALYGNVVIPFCSLLESPTCFALGVGVVAIAVGGIVGGAAAATYAAFNFGVAIAVALFVGMLSLAFK